MGTWADLDSHESRPLVTYPARSASLKDVGVGGFFARPFASLISFGNAKKNTVSKINQLTYTLRPYTPTRIQILMVLMLIITAIEVLIVGKKINKQTNVR